MKKPVRSLPRFKLRYLLLAAVCTWAGYHYWHVQRPQLEQLSSKQAKLESQLAALQKQHDQLVQQAQQLQDDRYIARYASDHYNLVLPGQVPFDIQGNTP
ncbi:septum formation initiator family protein [Alicyclobacillus sp.]|uniref:septum formation initiator family protein n=1 Tax=Alicyclobacillus sp. TaxID=61169 RepID=UPI0025C06781|nr:septum formation initiator family protein [Alicyclobacillus sp.]MCL6517376.1 septum formation initiator family protein [Alicyclobacillus sp.]